VKKGKAEAEAALLSPHNRCPGSRAPSPLAPRPSRWLSPPREIVIELPTPRFTAVGNGEVDVEAS